MSKADPGSRRDQMLKNFLKFHAKNPSVYELFKKYAFETIQLGRKNYSADAIVHRIRWHTSIETHSETEFKINDHYVSYYARMFMLQFPEHMGYFRVRERRTSKKAGSGFAVEPGRDPDDPMFLEALRISS